MIICVTQLLSTEKLQEKDKDKKGEYNCSKKIFILDIIITQIVSLFKPLAHVLSRCNLLSDHDIN